MNKKFLSLPQETQEQLLDVRQYEATYPRKELAAMLGHSRHYVDQMVRQGFPMLGGLQTLRAAKLWLAVFGEPYSKKNDKTAESEKT